MKKKLHIVMFAIMVIAVTSMYGQVTFNSSGPATPGHPSTDLELQATDKGFGPNQVALTSAADATTIATPKVSLLIYNTATAGTGVNAVTPGYYYWTGSRWDRFMTGPLFQSVESTAGVVADSTVWQIIPGATLTANYLAGDVVNIHYPGNMTYSGGGTFGNESYAFVDIVPYVNGIPLSIGGYVRGEVNLDYGPWWLPYSSIAVYTIPSSGSYTFNLRTRQTSGDLNVVVGGDATNAAECVFTITTYRK